MLRSCSQLDSSCLKKFLNQLPGIIQWYPFFVEKKVGIFQGFPPLIKLAFVWVGVLHHDPFTQLPSSEPPGPYSSLWGIAQQKICCVTVHKERLHWRENQKRQKARDDILRKKGPPYKTSSKSSENKIGINNSKGKWIIFQPLIFRGFCC